ncbi:MAG: regulatory iron-sulfur-containing complex subunit RicT [Candidatus Promineifilaceae bacterium]|nr:regulatory iron-sulfur-containing complex subunit RicT [Candidatus Promineifilaceae bacterium]
MVTKVANGTSEFVGIRFQKLGKLYHFRLGDDREIQPGDHVIVDTNRGRQLGQIVAFIEPDSVHRPRNVKRIVGRATPRDLVLKQVWESKELNALITCRERAAEAGIKDAKFLKAEYSYDGSWLTFSYSSENKKLDIKPLQRTLNRMFRSRVEMRLVGPRDVAKIMGGYGACGAPRCCSTFLTEFSPVSIKMAKVQGISLSPQEITGMCGRLRCCLVYEYEQYVEARKHLPKKGKRVETPYGRGKVLDVRVLADSVIVALEEGVTREVFRHELEPFEELQALQEKAAKGCNHGEGCSCGARNGKGS